MKYKHVAHDRADWPPRPGFFTVRLVRNGWATPARIVRNESGEWQAEVNGLLYPANENPGRAAWVPRIWAEGTEITEPDYLKRLATLAAAGPDHPARNPSRPVDLMKLPPIIPVRTP